MERSDLIEDGIFKLNDTSGLASEVHIYTSSIIEELKRRNMYNTLVDTIRCSVFTGASKKEIVSMIRSRFPDLCKSLCVKTFNQWIEYYPEINDAMCFTRDYCLGNLVHMGMMKALKSVDYSKDDFILKMMDRVDYGVLNKPNTVPEPSEAQTIVSSQTVNTVTRIMAEASRFSGLDNVVVDDSDED